MMPAAPHRLPQRKVGGAFAAQNASMTLRGHVVVWQVNKYGVIQVSVGVPRVAPVHSHSYNSGEEGIPLCPLLFLGRFTRGHILDALANECIL